MNHELDSERPDAFLEAAKSRGLLTAEQAESLRRESRQRSLTPAQVAIESGLMTSVEVEIAEAFADPHDLAPGYQLLEVLGYGALGVVYRARQPRLERDVAIKSILPDRRIEKIALARFQQEGAAIGRLQHPNIVSAYDSGTHKHRFYLVMELVRGTDLRMRLDRDGPMEASAALSIARQVASGLSHALSHDIIHRDIKPGNLILTEAPTGFDLPPGVPLVKIADFGLARLAAPADGGAADGVAADGEDVTRLTVAGSALGTPMYCAPEQLSGDPVDHRADIYSLGTTLLNMLTGKPPFAEQKIAKLVTAKLTGKPHDMTSLPRDLPDAVVELLEQMMAYDPDQRIANYQTLIDRIDAVRRQVITPRAWKTGRRLTMFLVTVVGAVLLCLAALLIRPPFTAIPRPAFQRTLQETPLFDGENVEPWKAQRGLWRTGQDEDKAYVLIGRGVAVCDLPGVPAGQEDTSSVAFRVGVDLLEAEAAEIHFGFEGGDLQQSERLVVRYTPRTLVMGRRAGLDGELRVRHQRQMRGSDDGRGPRYHHLIVERHRDDWFVYLEGEDQPFAFASLNPQANNRTMQLVAIGGDVHFSDIASIAMENEPPPDR